eukprot:435622-Prorocentrum_minimum.AAC.1
MWWPTTTGTRGFRQCKCLKANRTFRLKTSAVDTVSAPRPPVGVVQREVLIAPPPTWAHNPEPEVVPPAEVVPHPGNLWTGCESN